MNRLDAIRAYHYDEPQAWQDIQVLLAAIDAVRESNLRHNWPDCPVCGAKDFDDHEPGCAWGALTETLAAPLK